MIGASTQGNEPATMQLRTSFEKDLAEISRRETHLWAVTLGLLVLMVGVLALTFFMVLADPNSPLSLNRAAVTRAAPALLLLILVFCIYVAWARKSFSKVRTLFETQALKDSLTGLLNRQSFSERTARELRRADRNKAVLGVLLCDLDDFKKVNDTYGHPIGDEVLQHVAKAVLSATRGTDIVFRWGGDEILVLLSPTERGGALTVAQRIREEVKAVTLAAEYPVDVSIGISLYPEHATDAEEMIRLADKALYIAKKSGEKTHIGEEELPLGEDAVTLAFQAVVESTSRTVIGYEILSRDPEGKLSITELFRRYEAVGQLTDLKRMILAKQLAAVSERSIKRAFINVDFALLQGLDPLPKPKDAEVILEISESEAVKSVDRYLDVIDAWREQGFRFAIDDFGSGFLSLPFVARLVPTFIKMDRSAILQAAASERFGEFLRDMLGAMRNYSRHGIIAEGVETEYELKVVNDLGVSQVQGHLLGLPGDLDRSEES